MAEEKPLLFPHEVWAQNAAHKRELIELMRTGNAILFVGSGCTSQVDPKYLKWNELIEALEKLAKDIGSNLAPDKEQNKLKYADNIKEALRHKTGDDRRYYAKIHDIYSPNNKNQPGALHEKLIALPVKGFVTTNYDSVLVLAFRKFKFKVQDKPFEPIILNRNMPLGLKDFLHSSNGINDQQNILHIHGVYDRADTIILTQGEYNYAYRDYGENKAKIEEVLRNQVKLNSNVTSNKVIKWLHKFLLRNIDIAIPDEFFLNLQNEVPNFTLHRKVLWSLFATQRLIFVGYGMEEDIKSLLGTVCDDLLAWDTPYHYAIMEGTTRNFSNAIAFEKKYGVRTVFYENEDGTHKNLINLLSEICDECNIGVTRTRPTVLAEKVIPLSEAPGESTAASGTLWMKGITEASKRKARPDENQ